MTLFCNPQEGIHYVGSSWERQLFVINWCICYMLFPFERLTLFSLSIRVFLIYSVISLSFQKLQQMGKSLEYFRLLTGAHIPSACIYECKCASCIALISEFRIYCGWEEYLKMKTEKCSFTDLGGISGFGQPWLDKLNIFFHGDIHGILWRQ